MADFPFTTSTINTTNSVSVGNSTVNATVNSTSIGIGSNLTVNSTSIKIGNSTVNATVNSSAIELRNGLINVSLDSADTAGSGMNIPTSIKVGNSTVNAVINSTSLGIGSNVLIGVSGFSIGNSTVNTVANSTAFSVGTGFYIAANGNVGINTSSPTTKLHIVDSSGPVLRMVRTSNRFDIEADTDAMGLVSRDSATAKAYFSGFAGVGIGTTTPQSKLEVATSSGNFSHFGATSTASGQFTGITLGYRENNSSYRKAAIVQEQIADNSARGHLHLLVDIANDSNSVDLGDSKLMIHGTTGNVGIGTTNPGAKLHVEGFGFFTNGVLCLRSTQFSSNGDYLSDLDGYGGSAYDGYYSVARPGFSSAVLQFNVGGSTGTIQFAFNYGVAAYRRNKTDNNVWSSWRQVD